MIKDFNAHNVRKEMQNYKKEQFWINVEFERIKEWIMDAAMKNLYKLDYISFQYKDNIEEFKKCGFKVYFDEEKEFYIIDWSL